MHFTQKQTDVILAGLRLVQISIYAERTVPGSGDIKDILTGGGEHAGLSLGEIDSLCESLNLGGAESASNLELRDALQAFVDDMDGRFCEIPDDCEAYHHAKQLLDASSTAPAMG